jgi:hypothetical protein
LSPLQIEIGFVVETLSDCSDFDSDIDFDEHDSLRQRDSRDNKEGILSVR